MLTSYMNLDFEMDADKVVDFSDSKESLVIRLVKTKLSSHHLLIKPTFKVLNCFRDLHIISSKRKGDV